MVTHSDRLHRVQSEVVPAALQYHVPPSALVGSSKRVLSLPPQFGTTFYPGNQIRLKLESGHFLNNRSLAVSFDVNWSIASETAPTNFAHLQRTPGSHAFFSRVRLLAGKGQEVIADTDSYNVITSFMVESTSELDALVKDPRENYRHRSNICSEFSDVVLKAESIASGAKPKLRKVNPFSQMMINHTNASATTFTIKEHLVYKMQLTALTMSENYFPVEAVNGLIVELTLDSADNVLANQIGATVKNANDFFLDNVKVYWEAINAPAAYLSALEAQWLTSTLKFPYQSLESHITSSQGQKMQITLNQPGRSVQALFICLRASNSINSASLDGIRNKTFAFGSAQLTKAQLRIGTTMLPVQPIEVHDQGSQYSSLQGLDAADGTTALIGMKRYSYANFYEELFKASGEVNLRGLSRYDYENFRSMLGFDLSVYDDAMSGLNTSEMGDIHLLLEFSSDPGTVIVNGWFLIDNVLEITSAGVKRVYN